jgi:hypothetical protein
MHDIDHDLQGGRKKLTEFQQLLSFTRIRSTGTRAPAGNKDNMQEDEDNYKIKFTGFSRLQVPREEIDVFGRFEHMRGWLKFKLLNLFP